MAEKFASSREAKDAKWFSRRHPTSEAHEASSKRDRKAQRREEAEERRAERDARTDAEQLVILADRGITEGREVERLKKGL